MKEEKRLTRLLCLACENDHMRAVCMNAEVARWWEAHRAFLGDEATAARQRALAKLSRADRRALGV